MIQFRPARALAAAGALLALTACGGTEADTAASVNKGEVGSNELTSMTNSAETEGREGANVAQ